MIKVINNNMGKDENEIKVVKLEKEVQQLKNIVKTQQRQIIALQRKITFVAEQSRVTTEGLRRVQNISRKEPYEL